MRLRLGVHGILSLSFVAGMTVLPQEHAGTWAAASEQRAPACNWVEAAKDELRVPILRDKVFGNVLLCIEVNGRPAQVILDTGSNVTIVSADLIPGHQVDPSRAVTPLKGSGYVSTGQWGEANLHLGGKYWINRRILVDEMKSISQAHKQRIDGILGTDILKEFKLVIIDYEKNVLTLGSK